MKIRDSGMPAEAYWESLFDVPLILSQLAIERFENIVELGCGYGTFTIPVARAIRGTLHTFDVDPQMLARTRERANGFERAGASVPGQSPSHAPKRAAGLRIIYHERDVVEQGFGVEADAALLFNILHCDQPVRLLQHAAASAPHVLVIHWRHGDTPRGPALAIRPRPEQIIDWARAARLHPRGEVLDLPPWHYGLELCTEPLRGTII